MEGNSEKTSRDDMFGEVLKLQEEIVDGQREILKVQGRILGVLTAIAEEMTCMFLGCNNEIHKSGMCKEHYEQATMLPNQR